MERKGRKGAGGTPPLTQIPWFAAAIITACSALHCMHSCVTAAKEQKLKPLLNTGPSWGSQWRHSIYNSNRRHVGGNLLYCSRVTSKRKYAVMCGLSTLFEILCLRSSNTRNRMVRLSHFNALFVSGIPTTWRRGFALSSMASLMHCTSFKVTLANADLQGGPKKFDTFLRFITSSNSDQYSDFFHCQNQKKICNSAITKDLTEPQVCRQTTLWNVSVLKATTESEMIFVTTHFRVRRLAARLTLMM